VSNTTATTHAPRTAQHSGRTTRRIPRSVTCSASNIRDLTFQNPTPKIPKSVTWFSRPKISPSTYERFAAKGKPSAENLKLHLILLRCDYARVVTNIPREVSICFNSQIALSAVAELLACSICRRSAFSEGSLSLIVHRHTNTLASWKLAIRTLWLTPGNWASKEFVCGRDISPASRTKNRDVNSQEKAARTGTARGVRPRPPGSSCH
jgi:hypothetical protein